MSQIQYDIEIQGAGQALRTQTISAASITIGRESGDIVIGDPQASANHAQLLIHDGAVWLRDTSTNGTFINGQRVTEVALSVGTVIQIGQSWLRLLAVHPLAQPGPAQPSAGPSPATSGGPAAPQVAPMVSPGQQAAPKALPGRQQKKKRSGGKKKWIIPLAIAGVVLIGVPFLPHKVVASLNEDGEVNVGSVIQWWHGVWRGDRLADLEEWAFSACECTQFSCMKEQSLEFLTLMEKYGDGESVTVTDPGLAADFAKGAKCLNDIAVKTFEDQSAAMCACTDAACAQRESAALKELIASVADLRSIGSEDATPTVKAAVAAGNSCLAALNSSPGCLLVEKIGGGVKSQMADITKNLDTAGNKVSYEKSALVFETAAKDLAAQLPTFNDPALKPVVQPLLVQLQAVTKSYRTRASLEASGDTKAIAKAKAETVAIYGDLGKVNDAVYPVCHPEAPTP